MTCVYLKICSTKGDMHALTGTSLIISHDRWFLDRLATHILAFEDDGSQACLYNCLPHLQDCWQMQ